MKLYIGGAWQGLAELARDENPGAEVFADFHENIRAAVLNGEDPREFARKFCTAHPDAVIAANEVGAGIVPMAAEDRKFREAVGRALCVVAQQSVQVTRCVCGIGMRIK